MARTLTKIRTVEVPGDQELNAILFDIQEGHANIVQVQFHGVNMIGFRTYTITYHQTDMEKGEDNANTNTEGITANSQEAMGTDIQTE